MNRVALTLLTLGLSLASVLCWAAEPNDDQAKAIAESDKLHDRERDYRKLVEGLVSPNKPIEVYDENSLRYPPNYDLKSQELIERNRQILYEHCEAALPFLIERSTDSRYALTWLSDSYAESISVGEVCLQIVASHLEVYRKYMPSLATKKRFSTYNFVPRIGGIDEQVTEEQEKENEVWWRGRKGKTLLELQIEALDWAIEKSQKETGTPIKEIERLVAVRDKLKQDRKCLPPKTIPPSVGGSGQKNGNQ